MPFTMRAAVPLLNWSLRTASCQETEPEFSRATTASTIHGSSAVMPTRSRMTPPVTMYSLKFPFSVPLPIIGTSSPIPPSGSSSRHHRRRRAGLAVRTTPSGSMTTPRRASSVTATAAAGTAMAIRPHEYGRRVEVAREDAEAEDLDRARDLAADQEEAGAEDQPEHRSGERLARGDPAGHPAVGADQPQRREPAVAPLAAEAYGRGDEDADRHQQHHEDREDEQQQDRVHLLRGRLLPWKVLMRVMLGPSPYRARFSPPE